MNNIKSVGMRLIALATGREANENGISLFDVKALYDAAYEEKAKARACLSTFRCLLAQAEKLDAAYRAQLAALNARPYGKGA
ncbi:MAG: hypothetical protein VYB05_11990 [Pseudomonadota bacterium]|nr:hypothetical protein [Pseudomonadota bacterium]